MKLRISSEFQVRVNNMHSDCHLMENNELLANDGFKLLCDLFKKSESGESLSSDERDQLAARFEETLAHFDSTFAPASFSILPPLRFHRLFHSHLNHPTQSLFTQSPSFRQEIGPTRGWPQDAPIFDHYYFSPS